MSEEALRNIETLVRARYPLLVIPSYEEERVEQALATVAANRKKDLLCWTVTRGLYPHGTPLDAKKAGKGTDPLAALDEVIAMVDPAIFLFHDFHPYLGQPEVVRKLRDVAGYLKSSYKTLVFVSPHFKIPSELEKDVTVVDFPLPSLKELHRLLSDTVREVNESTGVKIDPKSVAVESILKAAQGLTLKEAENVFAKSLVLGGRLTEDDIPVILEEKQQLIKKSGILEYYPSQESFDSIGGLEVLKDWLQKRRLAFTEKARKYGLPFPKGVLLVGIPGCGKSLCAKAVSAFWRLPLLRFDVGRVFSGTVGSSEENMRQAIATAEAVAPAILWIDEVEKAFAGVQSSSFSDGGTTARVFGSFITWLQEKRSQVFVITTANNIKQTPPELMRKGRLDEIFFVELPSGREREEILAIHLKKRGRDPQGMDVPALAAACDGFSGAEIEQGIISAMFDAFEKNIPLSADLVARAFRETVPLSQTMAEDIRGMREWAAGRARPASAAEAVALRSAARRKFDL